ncbi:MAG: LysR family transcriptional regulator [Bradyrhizobium sp.]|nr:LysR family transcriptional regulator [Bradyrhizobium sp.]
MRNLRSANLNLLPVLRVLLRHRHVTHAARALNMSQSSVSEALGKLRHLFNDELLVSSGGQMTLTALARRLEPIVEASLVSAEFLTGSHVAQPGARQAIDIAVNDYLILILGTELISEVRRLQPDLAIRFHDVDSRSAARLRSGDLDFMVTPDIRLAPSEARFERRLVFEDRVVCLVDEHSAIGDKVSEEEYWAAPHVFFSPKSDFYGATRTTILQQVGDRRADSTLVQSYLLLPFFVEGTDAIALAHRSLARALLPAAAVRIAEAPFDIDVRIEVAWDGTRAQDAQQRWFLDLLMDVAARVQARAG